MTTSPQPSPDVLRKTLFAVLLVSALGPFAVTGPAVVLPQMAADLHASSAATQWVQNGYNALFAATVLAAGSLADLIGRRRVLRCGIGIFGLCAAAIAASPSAPIVDVLRAVQGLGCGAIVSAGAAVLVHTTDEHQRVRAFGLLGASFGAGTAFGPLIAGLLSGLGGWRPVFAVIALGAAASFRASRVTPESRDELARGIDIPGMITFGVALLSLSYGFVNAGELGWSNAATVVPFIVTVALLVAFVFIELRSAQAMFDVRLFLRPAFTAIICQPFSVTFVLVVLLVYLPVFLQGQGVSALGSAVQLLPVTLPVLLVPLATPWLRRRWSVRALLVAGTATIGIGTAGLIVVQPGTSALVMAGPLLLVGVGVGLAFAVMDNAAVGTVPADKVGSAAGMFNTMRITGESLAVASSAAVLTTLIAAQTSTTQAAAALQGRAAGSVVSDAFAHSLHIVFVALAVVAIAGAGFTGWALREHATQGAEEFSVTESVNPMSKEKASV